MYDHIERRDTGPAWLDKTSAHYAPDVEAAEAKAQAAELRRQFARAAATGDANAVCPWAPLTTDWDAIKRQPIDQRTTTSLPKRAQTLAQLMFESLDYGSGPSMTEAMHLLLAAAHSTDTDLALLAGDLLDRMGAAFAEQNSGVAA